MSPLNSLEAEAIQLLHRLSGPHGIRASSSTTAAAHYRAVFARDAVMAGIAGLLLDDATIIGGLVRTLETLRALQGPEGQIASNYEMRSAQPAAVSFGTLAPRVDAATWYLIGIALAARTGALDPAPFHRSASAVVHLLNALEYNGRHLLYVPAGGNWADEYITDGYVLYDQVLRAWGLRLLSDVYDEATWREKSEHIAQTITARFQPTTDDGHPIASYSPLVVRDLFDLAACSLLTVSAASPTLAERGLDWIARHYVRNAQLPPAFHPVIDEHHPDWPALRRYHLHEFRNAPNEYHNGGIWPIWLGWLALAQASVGRGDDLFTLRGSLLTLIERVGLGDFAEFFHGRSGEPRGTTHMAYTATGIIFVAQADSPASRHLFRP